MTIRIDDEELKTKLDEYSRNKGVSRGEIVRKLLYKELKDKTTSRGKINKSLKLYFPNGTYWDYYSKFKESFLGLYHAELTDKDQWDLGIDGSSYAITINSINNCLDKWKHNTYKARSNKYDHEGLIILKDLPELYNIIFLVKISQKKNNYEAKVITLNKALELAKEVKNKSLYDKLITIKNDKEQFNKLYDTITGINNLQEK